MSALPNIVLVHGAWADGSSWSAVIPRQPPGRGSLLAVWQLASGRQRS
jgi:hypothetical protein